MEMQVGPQFPFHNDRHILSALARRESDSGKSLFILSIDIRHDIARAPVPRSPLEVVDRVLLDAVEGVPAFDRPSTMPTRDYTRYFLHDLDEFLAVLNILSDEGLLVFRNDGQTIEMWPRPAGWRRASELRERSVKLDQVFVALRFNDALKTAYEEGIEPALNGAGYRPLRIDRVPHNGTIDDRIIAEIRRSAFLVADLTEHANGVYFEAGFALGLGREVIWCCRKDQLGSAHFDVKQYNMIVWENPREFRENLLQRVRATMPICDAINEVN